MHFYLGSILSTHLIEKNPPRIQNRNFSKKNLKLTRFGLAIMPNKIANGFMNIAVRRITIKKI